MLTFIDTDGGEEAGLRIQGKACYQGSNSSPVLKGSEGRYLIMTKLQQIFIKIPVSGVILHPFSWSKLRLRNSIFLFQVQQGLNDFNPTSSVPRDWRSNKQLLSNFSKFPDIISITAVKLRKCGGFSPPSWPTQIMRYENTIRTLYAIIINKYNCLDACVGKCKVRRSF